MATQAELEAVIEANPDDVDAYLVLGDWLQAQNNPRGELIALQAAAHRDPSDKKLAQRANKLLDEHEEALLGPLRFRRREVDVTWRHGFIRDARVTLAPGELRPGLRELLDHPSGRFVQSLSFSYEPDVDAIVDILLEAERPKTLAELRIVGLEDRHVDRLRGTFPRLNRSLDVEWRTILDEIAAQRKLDIRFDLARLPALERSDGAPQAIAVDQILLGMRMEIDKGRGPGIVRVMKRTFTADSLDRFVVELARQHVERNGGVTTRWAWRAVGLLGGRHAARWIGESVIGWQKRALHAIEVLAEVGTDHALLELAAIANDPRYELEHRTQARHLLQATAYNRKLSVDDLLDRSIPADLGPRGNDVIMRRLRLQMLDGRRIGDSTFRHHIATHPVLGPLAARLVWAIYDGRVVRETFRVRDDGIAIDLDGAPVELSGMIGILHPAELAPDQRETLRRSWRDVFTEHGIEPMFPQLDRTVHTLGEHETGARLHRFGGRAVGIDRLRAVLEHQRGWEEAYNASYQPDGWRRRFVRDDVLVTATSSGGELTLVTAVDAETQAPIAFQHLHPVTVSELLDDLETATAEKPTPTVAADGPIEKGTRVEIVRGRDSGKHGIVFWVDAVPATRVGVRGDDGDTYWADLAMVIVEGAAAPAQTDPWFDKGARVRWRKGRNEGTGTVFWMGKNKFGDGLRVGVKDDANGETVWANAKDCALADDPAP